MTSNPTPETWHVQKLHGMTIRHYSTGRATVSGPGVKGTLSYETSEDAVRFVDNLAVGGK